MYLNSFLNLFLKVPKLRASSRDQEKYIFHLAVIEFFRIHFFFYLYTHLTNAKSCSLVNFFA